MRKECSVCDGLGWVINYRDNEVECSFCAGEGCITVDPEEERAIANCLDEGEDREWVGVH